MIKRLVFLITLSALLSGCYMAPLALLGPASTNFKTASLVHSAVGTSANFIIKKSTGKTLGEHAIEIVTEETLQQTFFPQSTYPEIEESLEYNKIK